MMRARRRWRRRRSGVGDRSRRGGDRRLHHFRLAAVEQHTTSAPRCSAARAASTIDSPDRRRGSSSTSSSCSVNEIQSGAGLAVGVEHVAHEPGFGDRRLRLRQPQVDERRLLRAPACRGSGAPPRARTDPAGTTRAPAAGSRRRAHRDGGRRPRVRSTPPTLVNRRPSRSNNSCAEMERDSTRRRWW